MNVKTLFVVRMLVRAVAILIALVVATFVGARYADGPVGMLAGGTALALLLPSQFENTLGRSSNAYLAAGVLVGIGTQLGSGCTSGHGICGIGRLSKRSVAATMAFMASAGATVAIIRHVFGGSL